MATNKERAPVMEAEQWKDRLAKEEVAYYHGREIRQRQTCTKVNDFSKRCAHIHPKLSSSRLCAVGLTDRLKPDRAHLLA